MNNAAANRFSCDGPAELLALFDRFLNSDCSDADATWLNERLATDEAARDWFVDYCALCGFQREIVRDAPVAPNAASTPDRHETSPLSATATVAAPVRHARRPAALLIAAGLILAAAGVGAVAFVLSNRPASNEHRQGPSSTVASVIDVIGGTLVIGDEIAAAGQDYRGATISLDAGESEFVVSRGATVLLRGKSRLELIDPLHASLLVGDATFECPPSVKGYTIHLPGGARVVDLGTRFSIRVDKHGDAVVRVLEGSVEATAIGGFAQLNAGQSVVVRDGRLSNIVDVPTVAVSEKDRPKNPKPPKAAPSPSVRDDRPPPTLGEPRTVLLADDFDLNEGRTDGTKLDGGRVQHSADNRATWRSDGADTRLVADTGKGAKAGAAFVELDDKARKVRLISLSSPIPDAGPIAGDLLKLRVDVNLQLATMAVVALADSGGAELALTIGSSGGCNLVAPGASAPEGPPQKPTADFDPNRWHVVEITIDRARHLAYATIDDQPIGDPAPVTLDPDRLVLRTRVRGMHIAAFDNLWLGVGTSPAQKKGSE